MRDGEKFAYQQEYTNCNIELTRDTEQRTSLFSGMDRRKTRQIEEMHICIPQSDSLSKASKRDSCTHKICVDSISLFRNKQHAHNKSISSDAAISTNSPNTEVMGTQTSKGRMAQSTLTKVKKQPATLPLSDTETQRIHKIATPQVFVKRDH